MSFWRRLFGSDSAGDAPPPPADDDDDDAPPRAPGDARVERARAEDAPPELGRAPAAGGRPPETGRAAEDCAERDLHVRLAALGTPDGPSPLEVLAALRSASDTVREAGVLDAIVAGLERAPHVAELEPVRVAVAALLSERGLGERALAVARACHGAEGMLVASDLYAARGELALALGTIERVLARAYDLPGARERHARWSTQLGRTMRTSNAGRDAPTAIRPAAPNVGFRLLREVARGGAGTVYEAEDELLGRRLALKIFHGGRAVKSAIAREAELTARLAGAGVVRIYDADPDAGWLACEWIALGSLRDLVEGGRVGALVPLAGWLPALARALARVHALGLVHADLKPSNVLFRAFDEPLLGDFGSACAPEVVAPGGTAGFLSPERIAGAPAAFGDDVYAFGRIVEDVASALAHEGALPSGRASAAVHDFIAACLGPERPRDGGGLDALLRAQGLSA